MMDNIKIRADRQVYLKELIFGRCEKCELALWWLIRLITFPVFLSRLMVCISVGSGLYLFIHLLIRTRCVLSSALISVTLNLNFVHFVFDGTWKRTCSRFARLSLIHEYNSIYFKPWRVQEKEDTVSSTTLHQFYVQHRKLHGGCFKHGSY